ncbi:DUF4168 domain-containing protein [Zobellella taiwanensis]|jgi:hypothetical protein|uniref:DUF4168 domain-containing protein n=2 Tax=Zobellella taiwanensis TaxID=347535 RepID=A0A2P7QTJ7_9GAMM|nr:hypothetical protein C7I36_10535 [Zobellella taiwanensis]
MMKKTLTASALLSALLLATAPVHAQSDAQTPPPAAQQPAANIDDAQLEKFAAALDDIAKIQEDAMARLSQVEDQQKAQAIQQEANENMVDAVNDSGLSVEDYNLIANQLQTNPELQERLQALR